MIIIVYLHSRFNYGIYPDRRNINVNQYYNKVLRMDVMLAIFIIIPTSVITVPPTLSILTSVVL